MVELDFSDCVSLNFGTAGAVLAPSLLVLPRGLTQLILDGCKGTTLPSGLENLPKLQVMDLGGCSAIDEIPGKVLEAMASSFDKMKAWETALHSAAI